MSWLGWIGIALVSGIFAAVLLVSLVFFTDRDGAALGRELTQLLEDARLLGLPDRDVTNAVEMLEQAEFQEAFDIIVVQLTETEYAIPISPGYYQQIQVLAEKLKLPEQSYVFVKELIK